MKTTINEVKRIALIAHDNMKDELIEWSISNVEVLQKHLLCGTGTTSRLVTEATGLTVKPFKSGPLGGDQQIGSRIAEGEIDMMIFFSDPLEAQPHDPDIKALLRIAIVYDIPMASNRATADFLMKSEYMSCEYSHQLMDFQRITAQRVETIYKNMTSK